MVEGWLCPKCGSAHAPDVKTCPVTAAKRAAWSSEYVFKLYDPYWSMEYPVLQPGIYKSPTA